jgi:phosphatidylglycerol:prolipoprotein diacylglycerol transferase
MHPRLFELPWTIPYLGPITVYTYGVLLAAAYLLGLQLAIVRARKRQLDATRVMDLGIYIIISAHRREASSARHRLPDIQEQPRELLNLLGGGVFYGGLIVAVPSRSGIRRVDSVWTTCDVFAPGIALGLVVGRFGCFFAGCCYGKPTSVPWAITFTDPFAAANVGTPLNVPLHPTQLYEAGTSFLILVFLLATERFGRKFAGRTFWLYMLLYAVSRYVIEFTATTPEAA